MRFITAALMAITLLAHSGASALAADTYEPNNSLASATQLHAFDPGLEINNTYTSEIASPADVDYYKFTTTKPFEQVELKAKYVAGAAEYSASDAVPWTIGDASIDTDGGQVQATFLRTWTDAGDWFSWFPMTIPNPGTYYLKFDASWGAKPYTFVFRQPPSDWEPNDTPAQASATFPVYPERISWDGDVDGSNATTGSDTDVFSFPGPSGNSPTVTLSLTLRQFANSFGVPLPWDPTLTATVTSADGQPLVAASGSGEAVLRRSQGAGATAQITVKAPSGAAQTLYVKVKSSGYLGLYSFVATPTSDPGAAGPAAAPPLTQSQRATKCADAKRNVKKATRTLATKRKAYRKKRSRSRHRALRAAEKRLAAHKKLVKKYC